MPAVHTRDKSSRDRGNGPTRHPRIVMETLGHSQIALTMNTYSHVMPELQREAAHKMGELLFALG